LSIAKDPKAISEKNSVFNFLQFQSLSDAKTSPLVLADYPKVWAQIAPVLKEVPLYIGNQGRKGNEALLDLIWYVVLDWRNQHIRAKMPISA